MENTIGVVTEKGEKVEKRGISGSTLKLIAIVAMFIDHTGAIIVERMLMRDMAGTGQQAIDGIVSNAGVILLDTLLRLIGRLGFPIFCYLLIEGFQHTRNAKKYGGRLFLFALISEIPFDLGFMGNPVYWGYQNVFFTLFIGLLVMMGFRFLEEKQEWSKIVHVLLDILILIVGAGVAELFRTDYGAMGVLTITVMYVFRKRRMLGTGMGCVVLNAMSLTEITAFFAMIPIHMYNGKRGWNMKRFFYAFYPLHILLLYLIAYAMGLGQIMLR